jgi:hypothetical protein
MGTSLRHIVPNGARSIVSDRSHNDEEKPLVTNGLL